MEHNPYQAPTAPLTEGAEEVAAPCYVVAPRKFLIMQLGTAGLYAVYWFYRQWKAQNTLPHRDYWPIPRAIFAIFFTHTLFGEFRQLLDRRGIASTFAPTSTASVFVGAMLAGMVLGQFTRFGVHPGVIQASNLALVIPAAWALYQGQLAANQVCGDAEGRSNASLSAANIVWLVIGALLWALNLVLLYVATTGGLRLD